MMLDKKLFENEKYKLLREIRSNEIHITELFNNVNYTDYYSTELWDKVGELYIGYMEKMAQYYVKYGEKK